MYFRKKTSIGGASTLTKFLLKFFLLAFIILAAIMLIERINFPSPNKKIEKVIPNENFKIVK
tara:strand:- start:351 stop:536 length:186 start_codon:yes stop_codon:yes gene_type:complete